MYTHKGTIIRTILLAITWINVILSQNGLELIPVVSEETISLVLAGIMSVVTWFKNNYITLKTGKKQHEELKRKGLAK